MQDFLGVLKVIFVSAVVATTAGFFIASSFWWGTYFSIKMIIEMISGACS